MIKSLEHLLSDPRVKSIEELTECETANRTLTLKKGFIDSESDMHVILGRSVKTLQRRMKFVVPCSCWQCK